MKDLTDKKKQYEVPGLTVVSFKAERGYAASGGSGSGGGGIITGVEGGGTGIGYGGGSAGGGR
ncbi:MAG: hypothetical protein IJ634_06350 [Bacteroidales bacterium]|nr:hypothetical protein [Bacteroidales bacterium]